MLAVATVIMNRVASPAYPNNLRAVIYQSGQFAPTWNGSLNRVLSKGASSTAYSVAQGSTWRRKTFCSYKLFTVPLSIYRRIWYKCWWKCIFLIFSS